MSDEVQSLTEVSEQIRTRQLSPVEVVEDALRRAEALNPVLNCYITVLAEPALAEAAEAERMIGRGDYRGPLHGVPVSVKDLFQTAGVRTTSGSRLRAGWVPDEDATAVRKLKEAGAILLAKANTFQFACSPPHPDYGPTRNPWNLARTTRGSSSGSASAVAAGIDYGSIGSDTGGSIRVPASFCGLAGLKPTFGRVSRFGMQRVSWTMDHAGPLARSVADLALLLDAVSGFDERDPQSIAFVPDRSPRPEGRLDGLTIGVIEEFFTEPALPEILTAVEAGVQVMAEGGATIQRISIPELTEDAMRAHGQIMWPEAAHVHQCSFPAQADLYSDFLQEHLAKARAVPAVEYLAGQAERERIRHRVKEIQQEIDLFVIPTSPVVATELESMEPGADPRLEELSGLGRWNSPFDLTGQPALTVPCGFSTEGLPIGLQIVGRDFADELVLHAGAVYQARTEWHLQRPMVNALE
jgi:aspartyl-tRNA(Asn)/glutamyl-tRNA(Gln) amidotransferase subunit A